MEQTLEKTKRIIPNKVMNFFRPVYHWTLAFLAAFYYGFPSKHIKVIGVTGTKGKSSTVEILNAILEESGYRTALSNTIRFKVGDVSTDNLFKMSMPGRFFMQKFLKRSVMQGCKYAIIEMTSQGALLYRHRFIQLDCFIFTNLSPEHIEAHGSYDNYVKSKLAIAENMSHSKKPNRVMIINADDKESSRFIDLAPDRNITYSIHDFEPFEIKKEGLVFTMNGRPIHSHLSGQFNLYNIAAAITAARSQKVAEEVIIRAIASFSGIPGRVQRIHNEKADFTVIVDYAHTADSLEKLYQVFQGSRNICVLGGTGGGRDSSKRPIMGGIADSYCDEIILTDEDPYDENPQQIVNDVAKGIIVHAPTIIMDRRLAIREALRRAKTGDTVLITGKGTDPYIMGPKGTKTPWSDAKVAGEELEMLVKNKQ